MGRRAAAQAQRLSHAGGLCSSNTAPLQNLGGQPAARQRQPTAVRCWLAHLRQHGATLHAATDPSDAGMRQSAGRVRAARVGERVALGQSAGRCRLAGEATGNSGIARGSKGEREVHKMPARQMPLPPLPLTQRHSLASKLPFESSSRATAAHRHSTVAHKPRCPGTALRTLPPRHPDTQRGQLRL